MSDSRTAIKTVLEHPIYSTSATSSDETDIWIQESIAAQPYDFPEPLLIDGIYSQSKKLDPLADLDLAQENAAWEAASDEALMNFEKDLD